MVVLQFSTVLLLCLHSFLTDLLIICLAQKSDGVTNLLQKFASNFNLLDQQSG